MDHGCNISVRRDGAGRIVAAAGPGLVDLQINGYAGVDFNGPPEGLTAEALRPACAAIARRGVVAVLATLTTDAVSAIVARLARLIRIREQDELVAAMIAGFHVEGPMINAEDGPRGAHPAEHAITPADEPNLLEKLRAAGEGMVRILTLAPELPGALELIEKATAAGITVALGHHAASPEQIDRAVRAGAKMCTHLGNGSHAMLPRLENYIQRQLADDRLAAGFIADGHHIPFATLKNFLRAKQPQRSVLVTDAISAADMPPGRYGTGRRARAVGPDGAVRLEGTPYLAGSAVTLDRAVLNVAAHCDVSFETAWAMASTQPAALAGLPEPGGVEVDVSEDGFSLRR
jgi:N-acetylglucosamine-6-phosphate deacetylase